MSNWNYGDVWETVADVQPDAIAVTQGARNVTLARVRPRRRRHRAVPARPGRRAAGQGGDLPLQLARVPADHLRRGQGRPRPGQHQLPLRRRRAELPVGQRRRHRRRLPRGLRRPHRGHPRPRARRQGLALGRRRLGPCPDWATPYEDAAKSAIGRVSAPWGRSGDDLYMLYTGGTTGMPKGVMWRQDDLFARLIDRRHTPLPRRRRARGRARRRSRPARAASPSCRPARSCTARATSPPTPCWPRAARVCLLESRQVRPGRAARHHRAGDRSTPSSSWATPSPARCWPRSTSDPGSGT